MEKIEVASADINVFVQCSAAWTVAGCGFQNSETDIFRVYLISSTPDSVNSLDEAESRRTVLVLVRNYIWAYFDSMLLFTSRLECDSYVRKTMIKIILSNTLINLYE